MHRGGAPPFDRQFVRRDESGSVAKVLAGGRLDSPGNFKNYGKGAAAAPPRAPPGGGIGALPGIAVPTSYASERDNYNRQQQHQQYPPQQPQQPRRPPQPPSSLQSRPTAGGFPLADAPPSSSSAASAEYERNARMRGIEQRLMMLERENSSLRQTVARLDDRVAVQAARGPGRPDGAQQQQQQQQQQPETSLPSSAVAERLRTVEASVSATHASLQLVQDNQETSRSQHTRARELIEKLANQVFKMREVAGKVTACTLSRNPTLHAALLETTSIRYRRAV